MMRLLFFLIVLTVNTMRSLVLFLTVVLVSEFVKSAQMDSEYAIDDSRLRGSCMISTNNFNRSCIYHKVEFLFRKLPFISGWSTLQVGPLQLIKLPEYATNIMPLKEEKQTSRSSTSSIISVVSQSLEYFLDSYGIKISLPPLSKDLPGIVVEEYPSTNQSDEGRGKKKDQKRFAMVFPLIATFKFILIKALLIPILMGIVAIKKMLVMAAMAIPTIIAMLRICRFAPGGLFGPAGFTAAAAAPLMTAPYVASDTIIGDFSNYAPSAMAAQQTPYYNKQQDYGGKSFPSMSPYNTMNPY